MNLPEKGYAPYHGLGAPPTLPPYLAAYPWEVGRPRRAGAPKVDPVVVLLALGDGEK